MPVTTARTAREAITAPLAPYLNPERGIEEININSYGGVWLSCNNGETYYKDNVSITKAWADSFIAAIESHVGRTVTRDRPTLSAYLETGERVEIVIPPNATTEIISIRIPSTRVFSLDDYFFDDDATKLELIELIQARQTLLISGGTRSGKTALLSACLQHVHTMDRIIAIESEPELNIPLEAHPNQVRLFYTHNPNQPHNSAGATAMFRSAMRLGPDMISIAECRGAEALDFIDAANSGHYGMTTTHASTAPMAISKMASLAAKGETAMTHQDLIQEIRRAVYAVVQITRDHVTNNRVISPLHYLGEYK